jgi:hypothetical protein
MLTTGYWVANRFFKSEIAIFGYVLFKDILLLLLIAIQSGTQVYKM